MKSDQPTLVPRYNPVKWSSAISLGRATRPDPIREPAPHGVRIVDGEGIDAQLSLVLTARLATNILRQPAFGGAVLVAVASPKESGWRPAKFNPSPLGSSLVENCAVGPACPVLLVWAPVGFRAHLIGLIWSADFVVKPVKLLYQYLSAWTPMALPDDFILQELARCDSLHRWIARSFGVSTIRVSYCGHIFTIMIEKGPEEMR